MKAKVLRICLIGSICIAGSVAVLPQSPSRSQQRAPTKRTPRQEPTAEASPETSSGGEQQEVETLKIDTNLVTVPVIATSIDGHYLPDLQQSEFNVSEDGVKQEVSFFATVNAPFHVVLLLDTSASTREKLAVIRRAAVAFVEQLQSGDRVKVISFDDQVRDLNEFTNDRATLRNAINKTESGQGTKLYDAFDLALSSIRRIQGRRAIVLFTDGVDWRSDESSFDSTLKWLDEEGVIVYPIRYETRQETERIARQQAQDITPQVPTIGVIRAPAPGTTAPTFPSDDSTSVPTSGQRSKTGPLGLPLPGEILRRERERRDTRDRRDEYPDGDRVPNRPPRSTRPNDPGDPRDNPDPSRGNSPRRGDSISTMLDQLYRTADSYLNDLANKSGGRLLRADTLQSLPDAFAKIAAELRTQYAIGYYPINKARDGQYRKIKVTSTRKSAVVRARPGYRAPSGG
ncbi:MAG: VWA domain-containing protein [Acidobacteriota bacterium]|nr:VWA domain-containing protein [Acidobacteriota bacterium]